MTDVDQTKPLGVFDIIKILALIAPVVGLIAGFLSYQSSRIELRSALADIRRQTCTCQDDMMHAATSELGAAGLSRYERETMNLCDEKNWIAFHGLLDVYPELIDGQGVVDKVFMMVGGLIGIFGDSEYESDNDLSAVEAQIDRDYALTIVCLDKMGFDTTPYK